MRVGLVLILIFFNFKSVSCQENIFFKKKFFSCMEHVEKRVVSGGGTDIDFRNSIKFLSSYTKVSYEKLLNYSFSYSSDEDYLIDKTEWLKWYEINKNNNIQFFLSSNQFIIKNIIYEIINDYEIKLVVNYSQRSFIEVPNIVEYKNNIYHVTLIADDAFWDSNLSKIKFSNSIKVIGKNAFSSCKNLRSIKLPNSVISIGEYAFSNCKNLRSIELPNSVISIGKFAFSECKSLMSFQLPKFLRSISDGVFFYCVNLEFISIPNSVTLIGSHPFAGCKKLKSIILPNSIISIGIGAFSGCWSLKSIIIPNSVVFLDYGVFAQCKNLTAVNLSNSLTEINEYMFYNCQSLKSFEIPENVSLIGEFAFGECKKLSSIVSKIRKPDKVDIKDNSFKGIFKESVLFVPNNLKEVYQKSKFTNFFKKIKCNK